MIDLLIYHFHILAAIYAFTKNWQRRRLRDGFLAVIIIALAFIIIWSITSPLASLIMPKSWESIYFTKDSFSLILLFFPEFFFFYIFFIKEK